LLRNAAIKGISVFSFELRQRVGFIKLSYLFELWGGWGIRKIVISKNKTFSKTNENAGLGGAGG
jgi:hypothetical protein